MKVLEIPAGSWLKILKVTPHKENHGPDLIQAVSLRLEWRPIDNSALNQLADGLQDALLYSPEDDGQEPLDGMPNVKKHRRCPDLAMPVKLPKFEVTGYTMGFEHGIDETTALTLYRVKKTKAEAEVAEGGTAVIRWSANSNHQITPELVGQLCALEGTEVKLVELTPPDTSDAIDGSTEAFERDHPLFDEDQDAADAFAEAEAAGLNKDASEVPTKPRKSRGKPSLAVQD